MIGGARREEERSRAKERVFSFRDVHGQWDPRNQRAELWNLYNGRVHAGESVRAFPLSNWTELDIWRYIAAERIPVVPLYFAEQREVVVRGGQLIPVGSKTRLNAGEKPERLLCRFRTSAATLARAPCARARATCSTSSPSSRRPNAPSAPRASSISTATARWSRRSARGTSSVAAVPAARHEPDLLRFVIAGSVDDGKSTLVGRLLHDAGALYEDHVEAWRSAPSVGDGRLDLSSSPTA